MKALIVDDEEDLLDAFSFAVRRAGFTVTLARSGGEALAIVRDNDPFDVIVTDVRMPGGSGIDLIRAAPQPSPPFVLSTGFADLPLEDAYAAGVEAVLVKPFELTALQETVKRVTTPLAVRWSAPPPPTDQALLLGASAVTLGRGGVFASVVEPPRAGMRLLLELDLLGGRHAATGIVRWTRRHPPTGCGIELLTVDDPAAFAAASLPDRAFIPARPRI